MAFTNITSGLSLHPSGASTNRIQSVGSTIPALSLRASTTHNSAYPIAKIETAAGDPLFGVGPLGNTYHQADNVFGAALEFWNKGDSFSRMTLNWGAGGTGVTMGSGASAPNGKLVYEGNGTMRLQMSRLPVTGLLIDHDGTGVALDNTGGNAFRQRMQFRGKTSGGQNGSSRGGSFPYTSITTDAANGTDHSPFGYIDFAQTAASGWGIDDLGSIHNITGDVHVVGYKGGGDAYVEVFNICMGITNSRKGALVGNAENSVDILSGFPARACGYRTIIRESNSIAAYNTSNFGGSSNWPARGACGFESMSAGSQAAGTGFLIHGFAGWIHALQVWNSSGVRVSGIDGLGGVFTRVVSGAPNNLQFASNAGGLMVWDDTNNKLYVRKPDGNWKSVTLA